MQVLSTDYDIILRHPSGDGENMKQALEAIIEPNNIVILSREEFLSQLESGQIDYACIDGRSTTQDDGKPVVHVAGDAFGLYIMAPMEALADLGVSSDRDDAIVTKFLTTHHLKPTSHSGSHTHGDDSIATCDCGHCKTNSIQLDDKLLALANRYYQQPVQLVGDHKEQAIIISADKDTLVLVNTTNELIPGDQEHQAERQVFWNDAGAIELCIEHFAPSLAQIASQVIKKDISSDAMMSARKHAYTTQLGRTVQALKSSKPLADAGKIFTVSSKGNSIIFAAA